MRNWSSVHKGLRHQRRSRSAPELPEETAAITFAAPLQHHLISEGNCLKLSAKQGWPLGSVVTAQLALAQARETHALVRRVQAQKREALAWREAEIQRWEGQRQSERLEISVESEQRIDAAYVAYAKATSRFDTLYQQEWLRYERLTRPGLLWRIRRYWWASPGQRG